MKITFFLAVVASVAYLSTVTGQDVTVAVDPAVVTGAGAPAPAAPETTNSPLKPDITTAAGTKKDDSSEENGSGSHERKGHGKRGHGKGHGKGKGGEKETKGNKGDTKGQANKEKGQTGKGKGQVE
ncbi:hypothetical protein quinque_007644 [Culex quinquefasciatus]